MDDIFDSLIYIVITIAAFVISALGKKKKKQGQAPFQNPQKENVKRENPFVPNIENLIRQELGLEDRNYYDEYQTEDDFFDEKEVEITEEPIDSVPKEMMDDKPDVPYSVEFDNRDLIDEDSIQNSEIVSEENHEELVIDDFELQKAVIYSEILNRKYF